jgi:hypothetical protein
MSLGTHVTLSDGRWSRPNARDPPFGAGIELKQIKTRAVQIWLIWPIASELD